MASLSLTLELRISHLFQYHIYHHVPGIVPSRTCPGGHFHERPRQLPWQQHERGREAEVKGVKLGG